MTFNLFKIRLLNTGFLVQFTKKVLISVGNGLMPVGIKPLPTILRTIILGKVWRRMIQCVNNELCWWCENIGGRRPVLCGQKICLSKFVSAHFLLQFLSHLHLNELEKVLISKKCENVLGICVQWEFHNFDFIGWGNISIQSVSHFQFHLGVAIIFKNNYM